VVGPDHNLWFTEFYSGQIGRITPTGSLHEFPLPDPNSGPGGIVVGPDHNLWFTEFYSSKIGRMVTWLADRGVGAR
jgi:virginiamycin B lyase